MGDSALPGAAVAPGGKNNLWIDVANLSIVACPVPLHVILFLQREAIRISFKNRLFCYNILNSRPLIFRKGERL